MAKKVASECCAVPSGDYKPCLYLNLEGQDTSQLKGVTIGEMVEIVVTGKIVGVSQREYNRGDKKTTKTGSIDLEGYRVKVLEDGKRSEFEEMAEEEDE